MPPRTGYVRWMNLRKVFNQLLVVGSLVACTSEPPAPVATPPTFIDPPVQGAALAPNWNVGNGNVLLTWLENIADGHALYGAELDGDQWSNAEQIVQGNDFFANWADLPTTVENAEGKRFAHWLSKLGEDTYAYGVDLARQEEDGTWEKIGLLHDDSSPTEHGFASYAPWPDGGLQAFWLDGRAMLDGGAMQLRTTSLHGAPSTSQILDDRICECCSTDAALTANGPVIVYRDRDANEVRDIAIIRATADGWSEPTLVHADGWQIHGCPVNGPAVAADGERLAVAWFTAATEPRVAVIFSDDGGATFGAPVLVDGEQPLGRVDLVLDDNGDALVSWLGSHATSPGAAEIRWRRITREGEAQPVQMVAPTAATRAAGVPRMVRRGRELLFAWVDVKEPPRVRAAIVNLSNP